MVGPTPWNEADVAVGAIVRRALGRRAEDLTASEFLAMVRRFLAAGRAEIALETGAARAAAEAVMRANATRDRAYRLLAEKTTPGHPDYVVHRGWRASQRALEANTEKLNRHDDVVGYGLSYRRKAGQEQDERCVTVLVRKKLTPEQLKSGNRRPLPKTLKTDRGERIPVDVVEAGELELQVNAGVSLGPTNMPTVEGTIGTFAVDLTSMTQVALTAMHVAELGTTFTAPSRQDDPGADILGDFLGGTRVGVDAAKISVRPPATGEQFLPGVGNINGWRNLVHPDDRGIRVRMVGATSGPRDGFLLETAVSLTVRPIHNAILVDVDSASGDSGAALVDEQGQVLGLLVGQMPWNGITVRVFSPIAAVLRLLECDF